MTVNIAETKDTTKHYSDADVELMRRGLSSLMRKGSLSREMMIIGLQEYATCFGMSYQAVKQYVDDCIQSGKFKVGQRNFNGFVYSLD